jgi:MoaA/NifB/PqqE/SkfB family radical SAM enzyme
MDKQTIERVKIGLVNPGVGPETIALMLTKTCNLRCLYCLGGKSVAPDLSSDLSTEDLFALFKDASEFKVKDINLGGLLGEPFCRKDILVIIQEIKRLGLCGTMTTNGSLLNSKVAKIMADCKWDIIRISLDSADASIQHLLRPAINQKPYFQNIMEFLDTLQQVNSKLRVILNVVISKNNFRGLPTLVEFANHYKNIESLDILRLLNMGLINYENLQLDIEEIKEFKSILCRLKNEKKLGYQGNWDRIEDIENNDLENRPDESSKISNQEGLNRCFVNYYILSIDANGEIMKCPQYQIGLPGLNIRNSSLRVLWKNELLQLRKELSADAPCYKECCTILKEENKLVVNDLQ